MGLLRRALGRLLWASERRTSVVDRDTSVQEPWPHGDNCSALAAAPEIALGSGESQSLSITFPWDAGFNHFLFLLGAYICHKSKLLQLRTMLGLGFCYYCVCARVCVCPVALKTQCVQIKQQYLDWYKFGQNRFLFVFAILCILS